MIRRVPVLLATLAAALVVGVSPATAEPVYGPGGGTASASATAIEPGGVVNVEACGFAAGARIETHVRYGDDVTAGPVVASGSGGCATNGFELTREGIAVLSFTGLSGESSEAGRRGASAVVASTDGSEYITVSTTVRVGDVPVAGNGGGGTDGNGAGGGGGDESLPKTGGNLTPLWAGLALLVAGGALVGTTRRSRGSHALG